MALVEAVGEAVLSSGRMETNNVQSDAHTSAPSLSNGISVIKTARIPVVFAKELPDRCLGVGTKMDAGSRGVAKESAKGAGNAQQVLRNGTNEEVVTLDECTASEPCGSTSIPNGDGADSTHFPSSGSRDYETLIESVINCLDEKVPPLVSATGYEGLGSQETTPMPACFHWIGIHCSMCGDSFICTMKQQNTD